MKLALSLVLMAALGAMALDTSAFTNTKVSRKIDLTSGNVRITTNVSISGKAGLSKYMYAVPTSELNTLAFIGAKDEDGNQLQVTRDSDSEGGGVGAIFRIQLAKAMTKSETSIKIVTAFREALSPLPTKIEQGDPQLVVYEGDAGFLSPYKSKDVSTKVVLSTGNIESFAERDGEGSFDKGKRTIEYGPYENVESMDWKPFRVHFETTARLAVFRESEREVTVSHWAGKVAVEEHFELANFGASLKSGFARVEYQAPTRREGNSFAKLTASLPLGATNVYYRDIIGNISTSNMREELSKDRTVLEIAPRFPIFGGWRTVWYQGYDLSTDHCLSVDKTNGDYVLRIPASVPYPKLITESLRLRIVLPELASNIRVSFDGSFESAIVSQDTSTRFTYLDSPTAGRPVRIIQASNVAPQHKGDVIVRYQLPAIALWREPALFTGAIFIAFLGYIAVSRINLSLE